MTIGFTSMNAQADLSEKRILNFFFFKPLTSIQGNLQS